jgi:cytochrome b
MNTPSASPADTLAPVRVWDAPTRLTHWLMVVCFAGAWLTAESERWQLVHVSLGYTLAGLVAFRVVWGLVGTRHARFASFVRGPSAALGYLRSLFSGHPEHHTGHNPAGALAVIALLGLGALLTASGWATYNELGGEATEELHEALANGMLALVLVHVAAVVASSWLHRENLARAMATGYKRGAPGEAVARNGLPLAALILAAVLGFWAWQWQTAPAPGAGEGDGVGTAAHARHHHDGGSDDDDDDD